MLLCILCSAVSLMTCDPSYEYDFYVQNTTLKNVTVIIQIQNQKDQYIPDTIPLPPDSTCEIYTDESWGQTRNIAQPSDSVPAYSNIRTFQIAVKNSAKIDSVCYQQDPINFALWQHTGVVSGPGKSMYTFVVDSTIVH
jgi:hypothetical protein